MTMVTPRAAPRDSEKASTPETPTETRTHAATPITSHGARSFRNRYRREVGLWSWALGIFFAVGPHLESFGSFALLTICALTSVLSGTVTPASMMESTIVHLVPTLASSKSTELSIFERRPTTARLET